MYLQKEKINLLA